MAGLRLFRSVATLSLFVPTISLGLAENASNQPVFSGRKHARS
ncbi:hypothetical protein E2C01_059961 [Portunus trituberculatus]|uniref:Uncharacterized protein n=1 Tax=Portunus trituberculatus TaxID=210409 RepID=A0A5B7H7A4_PORTR|nr:hypothetical protein [Portunus trituberculatus]